MVEQKTTGAHSRDRPTVVLYVQSRSNLSSQTHPPTTNKQNNPGRHQARGNKEGGRARRQGQEERPGQEGGAGAAVGARGEEVRGEEGVVDGWMDVGKGGGG